MNDHTWGYSCCSSNYCLVGQERKGKKARPNKQYLFGSHSQAFKACGTEAVGETGGVQYSTVHTYTHTQVGVAMILHPEVVFLRLPSFQMRASYYSEMLTYSILLV